MRRGRRISWLDALAYRFQHRWETNPQYRAITSGVVGVLVLVTICGCMGLVTTGAQVALAGLGVGTTRAAAGGGSQDTGSHAIGGTQKFATPTVQVPSSVNLPPAKPIPSSQTPVPGPTPTPSPSPRPTATPGGSGGGPGGGGQFACSGRNWSINPCPVSAGQQVTISLDFGKRNANQPVSAEFSLCADGSVCTSLYQPPNTINTDGNGVWSVTVPVPPQAANSTVPISGNGILQGGPDNGLTIVFLGTPVQ
jgi:hypothetical protein